MFFSRADNERFSVFVVPDAKSRHGPADISRLVFVYRARCISRLVFVGKAGQKILYICYWILEYLIMIEEILRPLVCERFLNDARYREGHIRIINALPGVRIMGLHIPDMKKLARGLAGREDALEIIAGFEREAERGLSRREECGDGTNKITGTWEQPLYYEEKLVWGLMLNSLKVSASERFRLLEAFVPHIDNWAVCDTFCCSAKWVGVSGKTMRDTSCCPAKWVDVPEKTEASCLLRPEVMVKSSAQKTLPFWKCSREELWDFLQPYFGSDREFEVRFAVIMSMCCLLDREWIAEIFAKFDALDFNGIHSEYISAKQAKAMKERPAYGPDDASGVYRTDCGQDGISGLCHPDCHRLQKGIALGEPPYYVRMGVAWFLATALAKFPDETREYVAVSRLPEDVIKLYVRKARESFRTRDVSPF